MDFKIIEKDGVKVVKFKRIEEIPFVRHGFSTRIGGVSPEPFNQLNLGRLTPDSPHNIIENTKRFSKAVGVNFDDLVASDQVHKDQVKVVTAEDKGKGFTRDMDFDSIDALITNERGVPLITYFADCVPLLMVDPHQKAVGLAHAGWSGTVLKIGQKTVMKMLEEYQSRLEDIIVVIGPSIGQCCYEVSEDVVEKFNMNFTDTSTFVIAKDGGKYMLDLWEANRVALKEIGIQDRNIVKSRICTGCNTDLYFSHRFEKGNTGRMASIIEIIL
ncbi:peptidoglycan editing factor PgeF [Alkaliphilus hydrothermalis]|uniref:Purine nucleoside phosphorylase n=1 Tax=Alkaliphilus hydrothermalis TaxID=1482730 RepID=A0ABS2NNR3_9FIRM|nr:peptidoglycan editing factor PgeF [Alkaliphilus hydrothermalis]MBM7614575.1 YfiH family protein [Alkaliphilus hydrothermalis]